MRRNDNQVGFYRIRQFEDLIFGRAVDNMGLAPALGDIELFNNFLQFDGGL